jgi:hypothetical protein
MQTFACLILIHLYLVKTSGALDLNFDYCPRKRSFKFLVPLNAHACAHGEII